MLERLGYFIHRRAWYVLAASAFFLALAIASLVRGGPLTSATIDGLESGEADALAASITGHPIATTLVVHFRSNDDLDPNGSAFGEAVAHALEPLAHDARVLSVLAPRDAPPPLRARMVSPRAHAAYALVTLAGDFTKARAAYEDVRAVHPDVVYLSIAGTRRSRRT